MKRLINATSILSIALYVIPPFAAQAQDLPKITVDGHEVICLTDKATACPDGAFCVEVKKLANCEGKARKVLAEAAAKAAGGATTPAVDPAVPATDQAAADKAAADQAAADKVAADKAAANKAAADQAATEKTAADKAAKKAAHKAAADKAAADKVAADQIAADKAAADKAAADKAAADQAAAAKAATDQAAADKAATDQAAADKAAMDKAAADKAATDQAAADKAAMDKAAADKAAMDQAAADKAAADKAAADAATATAPDAGNTTVAVNGQTVICLPSKAAVCPDGALCTVAKNPKNCEKNATNMLAQQAQDAASVTAAQQAAAAAAAAAAADPNTPTVVAPVPTDQAVSTLETALGSEATPGAPVEATPAPAAAKHARAHIAAGTLPADAPPADDATVTTETVTTTTTRTSSQEFDPAPVAVAPGKKSGLSDLEKVGLVALGALVIGAIINHNQQVVSNTGDRVVVRQPDGTYQVYKDDNALLREPGSTVRTETFKDGSTRTIVQRSDGSQIVTIRDATGRVLQRVSYDRTGHPTVLIDDLQPEPRVDVSRLPHAQPDTNTIRDDVNLSALRAQLAAARAEDQGQKFSLRQIRNIPEVRYLAPTIDVNNITFATGSSAIEPTEARKLNRIGSLITQMIGENPGEVFLIEGHTDAVGSAASNLALSDRRAESVAKALTEYFNVPPENLVVQGYGESELKIDSAGDERANRRVAVRIITPILRQNAI